LDHFRNDAIFGEFAKQRRQSVVSLACPFLGSKGSFPKKKVSAFADFASFCSESSLLPSKICLRDLLWNLWLDMLEPRGTATVLMAGAFGFALVT
jgi:hypothetical protein